MAVVERARAVPNREQGRVQAGAARSPASSCARFGRRIGGGSRPRTRFASCWKGSEERIRSRRSAAERGLHTTIYYRWLKDFLEAGKGRLRGDSLREAGRDEVQSLKAENERLKQLVAEFALELVTLKKSVMGSR